MMRYTLRVDRQTAPKKLEIELEYDTDNLETIYSILWQNFDNWKQNHYINIYDIDAEDGIIYHYPEDFNI